MKRKRISEAKKAEAVKGLTWDYFWQAKLKEFVWIILAVVVLIYIPIVIGHSISPEFCATLATRDICVSTFNYWDAGLTFLFPVMTCLVIILGIPYLIIKSNWDKAKNKAKEKVYEDDAWLY